MILHVFLHKYNDRCALRFWLLICSALGTFWKPLFIPIWFLSDHRVTFLSDFFYVDRTTFFFLYPHKHRFAWNSVRFWKSSLRATPSPCVSAYLLYPTCPRPSQIRQQGGARTLFMEWFRTIGLKPFSDTSVTWTSRLLYTERCWRDGLLSPTRSVTSSWC